jgi:glutathione S-transferase
MKLFFSQTSPYARKVRLAAERLGLTNRIELKPVTTTPVAEDAGLVQVAPLGKIPTLVLDDGETLFDSRVILDYLDHIAGGGLIPPVSDPGRWRAWRIQAVADGLLDAALLMRDEVALRRGELLWREWLDGQSRKVRRALTVLEGEASSLADGAGLSQVAVVCALGYLDFRFPEFAWRQTAPGLAAFFAAYSQRPEMAWTDPTAV